MPQLARGWLAFVWLLSACDGPPDPRTVEGTLAYISRAVEREAPEELYKVIDERSRHAMISIVSDRREAARLVRESYPPGERAAALAALGDAAEVETAAQLFGRRCDEACRRAIGESVGAPAEVREEGPMTVVTTVRGTKVRLYRGSPNGWYGLEWHPDELAAERNRANRDLAIIRENAETFERRRALEREEGPDQAASP